MRSNRTTLYKVQVKCEAFIRVAFDEMPGSGSERAMHEKKQARREAFIRVAFDEMPGSEGERAILHKENGNGAEKYGCKGAADQ